MQVIENQYRIVGNQVFITRMSIAYSIQEHLQISGIIARPAVYDLLFSPIDEDIGWRFFQTYVYLLKHA